MALIISNIKLLKICKNRFYQLIMNKKHVRDTHYLYLRKTFGFIENQCFTKNKYFPLFI
jgi:hypothetical protein